MDMRGIVAGLVLGLAGCAIGPAAADGTDAGAAPDARDAAPPGDDAVSAAPDASPPDWWCFDQPGGFGGRQCYSDGRAACERSRADVPGAGPCYAATP